MRTKGEVYAGIRGQGEEPTHIGQIRGVTAVLVDNLEQVDQTDRSVARLIAMAQTKWEEACMLAVKAIYLADNPPN